MKDATSDAMSSVSITSGSGSLGRRPWILPLGVLLLASCGGAAVAPFPPPAASVACVAQAPALPSSAMPTTAAPVPSARVDVIIVGAGMAGLTAARTLRHGGKTVRVLEAQDRIGGRGQVDTTSFKIPVDLGGAWIHDAKTNPLTPMIVGMGFRKQLTQIDTWPSYFTKGHFATPAEQKRLRDALEKFEDNLASATTPKQPEQEPVDSAASEHLPKGLDKELLGLIAANTGPLESGAELSKTSTLDAASFLSKEDYFLERGCGAFVETWGQEVLPQVVLGAQVTKVDYSPADHVNVETKNGERFEGRRVLMTVSTGVLASTDERNRIAFVPELPADKRDAIKSLPMGTLNKVVLQFKNDASICGPTGKRLANAWVLYDGPGSDDMAFVFRPLNAPLVVAFFGGDRGRALELQGKDAMVETAMSALVTMCGKAMRDDLDVAAVTRWGENPYTFGAYSYAMPGAVAKKARERLFAPVGNALYFAGEAAYNATYNGSYAAAYSSALMAGHAILDCLAHEDRGEPCAPPR
jgi:monoamine oxidase